MAAQFSPRKGRRRRLPCWWMARATSSFPVPLSPRMSTGRSVAAIFSTSVYRACIPGDFPTRLPNDARASTAARSCRFCRARLARMRAFSMARAA